MKHLLLLLFCFLFKYSFAQVVIDKSVKEEYLRLFERLPGEIQKDTFNYFTNGISILFNLRSDTLNKKHIAAIDTSRSVKIININPETGKDEPESTPPNEEDWVNKDQPFWLSCDCDIKNDTLRILSGVTLLSGFSITTTIYREKAKAIYFEFENESKTLKKRLTDKMENDITIPATINYLVISQKPIEGMGELIGKIGVTTNGYYSYSNAWGFKYGYIHKRMRIEYYFRCNTVMAIK